MTLLCPSIIVVPAVYVVWSGWLAHQLGHGNSGQIAAMVSSGLVGLAGVIWYFLSCFGQEAQERSTLTQFVNTPYCGKWTMERTV